MFAVIPEYNIGDIVRIVSKPYRECPFTWVSNMDNYCGRKAEITDKWYSEWYGQYGYSVNVDGACFNWCGNCFESPEEFYTANQDDISFLMSDG